MRRAQTLMLKPKNQRMRSFQYQMQLLHKPLLNKMPTLFVGSSEASSNVVKWKENLQELYMFFWWIYVQKYLYFPWDISYCWSSLLLMLNAFVSLSNHSHSTFKSPTIFSLTIHLQFSIHLQLLLSGCNMLYTIFFKLPINDYYNWGNFQFPHIWLTFNIFQYS